MGMTSRFREWFDTQTALDKLALGLVFISLPVTSVLGLTQLAIMATLTGWIVQIQFMVIAIASTTAAVAVIDVHVIFSK